MKMRLTSFLLILLGARGSIAQQPSAAGPFGYLRAARLKAALDTFDTYTTPRSGASDRIPSDSYIRSIRQVGAGRWELTDTWIDSSGRTRARQSTSTGNGTLATEIETVRADSDSAALLISPNRVTAWVVPEHESPRLFEGPPSGDRYAGAIVISVIAQSKPAIGATFLAPAGSLFGPNPLALSVDTLRVIARETVRRAGTSFPVLVIERNAGTRYWVDEATGRQVAARGNAGPQRYWWHLRRGFEAPMR